MGELSNVDYKALGAKIKEKRKLYGVTQEKVAEKLDISESFYGRVERGDRILSVETLVKIAGFFDLSLDFLLLDSVQRDDDDKLLSEIDNIFRDKSQSEAAFLLNLLKIYAENIDRLQP